MDDFQFKDLVERLENDLQLLRQENRDLAEKLDRLDRSRRAERNVTIFLVLAAAFTATTAMAYRSGARTVVAEEIQLKDQDGVTRIRLGRDPSGYIGLGIFDKDRTCRLAIQADPSGPAMLSTYDRSGRTTMLAGAQSAEDLPGLTLFDKGGRRRMMLWLAGDGAPTVALSKQDILLGGKEQEDQVRLSMRGDGASSLRFDQEGGLRVKLGVADDGTAGLRLLGQSPGADAIDLEMRPRRPPTISAEYLGQKMKVSMTKDE